MKALIFGVTGQAGSYLAELLIEKGFEVHGVKRRSSSLNTDRVDHIYQDPHEEKRNFILHYGDVTDPCSINNIIQLVQPDHIYNLAAQSHVHVSFRQPVYTCEATAMGVVNILESIRLLGLIGKTKFLQASSSEMFGKVHDIPQTEKTKFYPRSPYGCAKVFGFDITKNYREAFGLFACNAVCFNMESKRRGETFVTRKITLGVARIAKGKEDCIYLGNLNAKRDWGHAQDYVKAMYAMMIQDKPDDFVISTGTTTPVREFAEMAFAEIGVTLEFTGEKENEIGVVKKNRGYYPIEVGATVIKIDPTYYRPSEVDILVGDSTKAKELLKWSPTFDLHQIVSEMVQSDIKLINGQG